MGSPPVPGDEPTLLYGDNECHFLLSVSDLGLDMQPILQWDIRDNWLGIVGTPVHPEKKERETCEEGHALLLTFGFCYIQI